jgi:hypothetical protein
VPRPGNMWCSALLAHSLTHTHTHAHICTHAHMHTHTCTHMHTHKHAHTHAHTHNELDGIRRPYRKHACARGHTWMHIMHKHTAIHTLQYTRTHTHARMDARARTHTHTHVSPASEWRPKRDATSCSANRQKKNQSLGGDQKG